jgi:hypothetical protein
MTRIRSGARRRGLPLLWEQEVARSDRVAPTKRRLSACSRQFFRRNDGNTHGGRACRAAALAKDDPAANTQR